MSAAADGAVDDDRTRSKGQPVEGFVQQDGLVRERAGHSSGAPTIAPIGSRATGFFG
jgi:hypothetical protein